MSKKRKVKKRRIKYKNIFKFIVFLLLILVIVYFILNRKIKNIYIEGNSELTDQEIIDIAGLKNYPKMVSINPKKISSNLDSNIYIASSKIKLNHIKRQITIKISENKPILYYEYDGVYLLSDGSQVKDKKYNLPFLINQTPDEYLKKLLLALNKLDDGVLDRISEIRYYPSKVDQELFYLTMTDGNYVYINFNSFDKLNNYSDFVKSFDNKKGILHLDSGDYLEILN